jgi:hypothetical protein
MSLLVLTDNLMKHDGREQSDQIAAGGASKIATWPAAADY